MDDIWDRAAVFASEGRSSGNDYLDYQAIGSIACKLLNISWTEYQANFWRIKYENKEAIEAELIKRRLKNGS